MDHKVSKDMISSGMIPSGEKSQADLGRTQYGSAPSPNSLFDAYKSMYEHHQKDKDGNTIPHEGEELNEGKMPEGLKNYLMKKKGKKEDEKDMKEENIDEVVFTGGAMLAGLAAKKLLGAAAAKGLKAGATALAKKAAVKTMGMGSRGVLKTIAKKGVGAGMDKAAGTAIKSGLKSAAKNPVNTALAGSMVMPQGGAPKPEAAQRGVTSGKRTAGMQRMDLDLFDVVKGQLLDEGLTEEECNDVMTTLTLDEINETLQLDEKMGAKLGARTNPKIVGSYTEKPQVPVKKKLGGRTDGTAGSYVEKPQIAQ